MTETNGARQALNEYVVAVAREAVCVTATSIEQARRIGTERLRTFAPWWPTCTDNQEVVDVFPISKPPSPLEMENQRRFHLAEAERLRHLIAGQARTRLIEQGA